MGFVLYIYLSNISFRLIIFKIQEKNGSFSQWKLERAYFFSYPDSVIPKRKELKMAAAYLFVRMFLRWNCVKSWKVSGKCRRKSIFLSVKALVLCSNSSVLQFILYFYSFSCLLSDWRSHYGKFRFVNFTYAAYASGCSAWFLKHHRNGQWIPMMKGWISGYRTEKGKWHIRSQTSTYLACFNTD